MNLLSQIECDKTVTDWDCFSKKGLFQVFKLFDIRIPRSPSSYLLWTGNGLSIMELQWPEFLTMHTFQMHASSLMLFPGKFYNIVLCSFSRIHVRSHLISCWEVVRHELVVSRCKFKKCLQYFNSTPTLVYLMRCYKYKSVKLHVVVMYNKSKQ